jgi:hypothetical protein
MPLPKTREPDSMDAALSPTTFQPAYVSHGKDEFPANELKTLM